MEGMESPQTHVVSWHMPTPQSHDVTIYDDDDDDGFDDDGFDDAAYYDDDEAVGCICNVVRLKPSKEAERVLQATRRRTDAAVFREHVASLDRPPARPRRSRAAASSSSSLSSAASSRGSARSIDLEKLVRDVARNEKIREKRARASRVCARRNHKVG